MSNILKNKVMHLTGITFAEKAILALLADVSRDGKMVFLRMDTLCAYASCSYSTAQRNLRRLEKRGLLIPQGGKGGRGYVHVYSFNLEGSPPEPVEEAPSLNGASPLTLEFLRRQDEWTLEEFQLWSTYAPPDMPNPVVHLQEMEKQHHE